MKESRTLEFRIRPTKNQKILIWKTFGCLRFVWNHFLEERLGYEQANKGKLLDTTPQHLKKENSFLCEVDSLALANVQMDLNRACRKLFAKGKKPKYRAKGKDKRSYTTNHVNGNIRIEHVEDDENYIRLPKLGNVRINLHRSIPDEWKLKHVTVKESASGKFFISMVFDAEVEEKKRPDVFSDVESLDYSMPSFAVSSSGEYDVDEKELHWYRNLEEKIKKEQKKLSRMVYGSANYYKQSKRVGALHEKAKNRRKDFVHKLSHRMAEERDAVVLEDMDLRGLAGALRFGKAIHDNGFGMFREILAYKMKERGKVVVKVSRFFPSSRRCSSCGLVNKNLQLSEREWTCPLCGTHHQRDKNACINLLKEGYDILNRWASGDSSLILAPSGVLSKKKLHLKIEN